MKVVADTYVIISGLLWGGPPNRILRWARDGILQIIECEETAKEVAWVIEHTRFSKRITDLKTSRKRVIAYLMNLITFYPAPETLPKIIVEDLFDNIFLALAAETGCHLIVSGDRHLLDLKEYENIQIVSPREAVGLITTLLKNS